MKELMPELLTTEKFASFGDVLEIAGQPSKYINKGKCARYHDVASLEFANDGKAGISLFNSEIFSLPYQVDILERHPHGSQAFVPMSQTCFLVVVANDNEGTPCDLQAFVIQPGQAINIGRNVWHMPLCPLATDKGSCGLFAVVDWIGTRENLEEYFFDDAYIVKEMNC